jgi:hypothetical protein
MRTFNVTNNNNDDDNIEKWRSYGLLGYANNERIMAYSLEYCIEIMVRSGGDSLVSQNNGMIIPIVFRVINHINPTTKSESRCIVKKILKTFPIFMLNNPFVNEIIMGCNHLDIEVELCTLFKDDFIRDYNR